MSATIGHPEVAARFPDLHPPFDPRAAVVEANRCLNCFDAPCMGACPTHIDVPAFIKKIASGNVTGSARTILEANVLGASCSRVCPVEVLCEGACVMHGREEKPIEIGRLQRFAMETYYGGGGRIPLRARTERKHRIACIGAGPASLACAAELRQQGFQVTIFDRRPLLGGLNTYGVAEYKLRAADSVREADHIRELGVKFETRKIDGGALNQLDDEYDAIFLGVGLGAMQKLEIEGASEAEAAIPGGALGIPGAARGIPGAARGIIDALEFIAAYKTGERVSVARRVVVIGAGNTAIDAAVAAKRLGAEEVTILYRRQRDNISAFDFEYQHALNEGVHFEWETLPTKIETGENGIDLVCAEVAMSVDGRLQPVPQSEFTIACDVIIPAIGQSPLLELLEQARGVKLEHGRVVIDRATGQTSNPRFFAGGDCVNGGREVVDAVADGKRAAMGIAALLEALHG